MTALSCGVSETSSFQLSAVTLRVPDLAASLAFYTQQLGFVSIRASATQAELAVAPGTPPLLTLIEAPRAPAASRSAAGLFHAALLFPDRGGLGAWLRRAAERHVRFDGFSDHGVSEAIYLTDPHGNGLEFYADQPRATWPREARGEIAMITAPLDIEALLGAGANRANETPLAGVTWGHLHLRVTDLDRSESFYRSALGLAVTQRSFPGARFLAADGYHHHLGLNTWGQPRLPQPTGALGLVEATWIRPGAAPQTIRDPDGITLRIAAG